MERRQSKRIMMMNKLRKEDTIQNQEEAIPFQEKVKTKRPSKEKKKKPRKVVTIQIPIQEEEEEEEEEVNVPIQEEEEAIPIQEEDIIPVQEGIPIQVEVDIPIQEHPFITEYFRIFEFLGIDTQVGEEGMSETLFVQKVTNSIDPIGWFILADKHDLLFSKTKKRGEFEIKGMHLERMSRPSFPMLNCLQNKVCCICHESYKGMVSKFWGVYAHPVCIRSQLKNVFYLKTEIEELSTDVRETLRKERRDGYAAGRYRRGSYSYDVVWEHKSWCVPDCWTLQGLQEQVPMQDVEAAIQHQHELFETSRVERSRDGKEKYRKRSEKGRLIFE